MGEARGVEDVEGVVYAVLPAVGQMARRRVDEVEARRGDGARYRVRRAEEGIGRILAARAGQAGHQGADGVVRAGDELGRDAEDGRVVIAVRRQGLAVEAGVHDDVAADGYRRADRVRRGLALLRRGRIRRLGRGRDGDRGRVLRRGLGRVLSAPEREDKDKYYRQRRNNPKGYERQFEFAVHIHTSLGKGSTHIFCRDGAAGRAECVIFFGCPDRGEKKDLKSKYNSCSAAIIPRTPPARKPPRRCKCARGVIQCPHGRTEEKRTI